MKLRNRSFFFCFGLCLLAHTSFVNGKELTEVNRVVAKVNDRFVTWGEINQAMDRLNFSESEKKQRAQEFVDGTSINCSPFSLLPKKGWQFRNLLLNKNITSA